MQSAQINAFPGANDRRPLANLPDEAVVVIELQSPLSIRHHKNIIFANWESAPWLVWDPLAASIIRAFVCSTGIKKEKFSKPSGFVGEGVNEGRIGLVMFVTGTPLSTEERRRGFSGVTALMKYLLNPADGKQKELGFESDALDDACLAEIVEVGDEFLRIQRKRHIERPFVIHDNNLNMLVCNGMFRRPPPLPRTLPEVGEFVGKIDGVRLSIKQLFVYDGEKIRTLAFDPINWLPFLRQDIGTSAEFRFTLKLDKKNNGKSDVFVDQVSRCELKSK